MERMDEQIDTVNWRLHKQKNETPCCYQQVRVKIVEPGPQMRRCDLCRSVNWFVLEPMAMVPGLLKLRWMTDGQVAAMQEAEREGIEEGLDVRDL